MRCGSAEPCLSAVRSPGGILCSCGAACTAFRRAIAANPADARAHDNVADVVDELRLTTEAREYWRQYLRFDASSE